MASRKLAARLLTLIAALALLALSDRAEAHEIGLSRGTYVITGAVVSVELVLSRREIVAAAPELDVNHDDFLSAEELEQAREPLRRAFVDRIVVKGDGAGCPGTLDGARLIEEDGLELRASYRCSPSPSKARVELAMLGELSHGHRHIARTPGGELVLFKSNQTFDLAHPGGGGASEPEAGAPPPGYLGFFQMGIEHILTGYDHLVFLLGLVLIGGRLRSLLLVITAFTVAHSITLGAAVLGVWAPSARIVEPLIGLSIAYVGVENFFVKDADKRWRITFPFGLIHGFGFAGALGEIRLPRAEIPGALVSFNLGVEAGQVAVLAVVLPLLLVARRRDWFRERGVVVVSAAIAIVGLFWFVTRALDVALF